MDKFPPRPFLTRDFSIDGGGIDYLGLRWVNLKLVMENLIPGINNVTTDMGTFFLGAWIPWKFKKLCEEEVTSYTEENYRVFRESVEVGIAHVVRDHSPSDQSFGRVRTRIGVEQTFPKGNALTFAAADRSENNTMYSAPLYGPSLSYLNLIAGHALSESNTATSVHLASDDEATESIVEAVEAALWESSCFTLLSAGEMNGLGPDQIDELGMHGLNPSFYRNASFNVKASFAKKLLPSNHNRTLTARLIVETLKQLGSLNPEMLRGVWLTGMSPDGAEKLIISDESVEQHRRIWGTFQARQVQRYFLESFLCCFERSVVHLQGGDFDENVKWLFERSQDSLELDAGASFADLLKKEAMGALEERFDDFKLAGEAWNERIYLNHPRYDFVEYVDDEMAFGRGLISMARWWIRMSGVVGDEVLEAINDVGGGSRVSASVLYSWIEDRIHMPLIAFCKELLSGMVFAQHLRIALSRMDGSAQRLRFTLGDQGIVATAKISNFGVTKPPWMADRLDAFLCLLEDLGVVESDNDHFYGLGEHADSYWSVV